MGRPGIAITHSKQAVMVMIDRHLDGATRGDA